MTVTVDFFNLFLDAPTVTTTAFYNASLYDDDDDHGVSMLCMWYIYMDWIRHHHHHHHLLLHTSHGHACMSRWRQAEADTGPTHQKAGSNICPVD